MTIPTAFRGVRRGLPLLLLAACSPTGDGGGVDEPVPGAPAAEAAPADTARPTPVLERVSRLDDFRGDGVPPGTDRFEHDPHRRIECSTCHADPPGHSTHGMIRCAECHATPGEPGGGVPATSECMGCHHARSRADECTRCHDDPGGPPDVRVTQTVDVAGTRDDPVRDLLFRHDLHGRVSCTTCHREGDTFAVDRDCASCHERHHRAGSDCLSCHAPLRLDVHESGAHEGCGGSSCHDDPTVLAFPPTRNVCLACHQDQTAHEPGGECARCHQLTRSGSRPAWRFSPLAALTPRLSPRARAGSPFRHRPGEPTRAGGGAP